MNLFAWNIPPYVRILMSVELVTRNFTMVLTATECWCENLTGLINYLISYSGKMFTIISVSAAISMLQLLTQYKK